MSANSFDVPGEAFAGVVGVDIGGNSARVCVCKNGSDKIELHVNRVSNRQTPTLVSFDKRLRIYGEEAESRAVSLFKQTIPILPYIAGLINDEFAELLKKRKYLFGLHANPNDPLVQFKVTFDDQPYDVYAGEVLVYFVEKLFETIVRDLSLPLPQGLQQLQMAYSIPSYFKNEHVQQIHNFLSIIGFGNIKYYKESNCLLRRWCSAHASFISETLKEKGAPPLTIAFLDIGFVHSSFIIAQVELQDEPKFKIIAEDSTDAVGTYQMIHLLCDHVCNLIKEKHGHVISTSSRQSFSILRGCTKALKDLSTIPDVKIEFERVLEDGDDFITTITRQELEDLASGLDNFLRNMIAKVVEEIEINNLIGIEILGGGSRIPFIKKIAESFANDFGESCVVRMSMDSTCAIAHGATNLLMDKVPCDFNVDASTNLDLTKLNAQRKQMDEIQQEQLNKMSIINDIDKYIIATRRDATGDYSNVLPIDKIGPMLDDLDQFSISAISEKSVCSRTCTEKLEECKQKIAADFPKYLEALEAAELERQRQLQLEEAEEIKSSRNSIDMDVVLPTGTCIKRASKNKQEGNVLLGDGNIEMAIIHYVKSIQYCAKASKPNEEQAQQLSDLRLASNLNLAMCYLKLKTEAGYNKAVNAATAALEISPNNPKAIFRRAIAYEELNNLDQAMADALHGLDKHPENLDLINRDALYLKKAYRLEQRLKVALFFVHSAAKSHAAHRTHDNEDYEDVNAYTRTDC
ncbi:bifunctional ATPase [Babesia duncani]|uniref:Bifunctional ATPase n=1 Tax=Babesia duncani TaxID=323732 RepID=A0AAD9PN43_9APIC|nr:bifunctional ATPase [Babesia duncani]